MKTSHLQTRHAGYALLLTLILLAMVAAGLAGVARRSHAASLEANRVERDTQRRWLAVTAETLLPDSDRILTDTSVADGISMATARFTFDLGHHHLTLTLADEQAKANLNTLMDRHAPAMVNAKTNALSAGTVSNIQPKLRPLGDFETTAAGVEADWPAFGSLEQVLASEDLSQLLDGPALGATLLDDVTLWGDGRLRLYRASCERRPKSAASGGWSTVGLKVQRLARSSDLGGDGAFFDALHPQRGLNQGVHRHGFMGSCETFCPGRGAPQA